MSNERSPREVCSTTIGTSELCARPICMSVLLFGKLQPIGCVRIATVRLHFGGTHGPCRRTRADRPRRRRIRVGIPGGAGVARRGRPDRASRGRRRARRRPGGLRGGGGCAAPARLLVGRAGRGEHARRDRSRAGGERHEHTCDRVAPACHPRRPRPGRGAARRHRSGRARGRAALMPSADPADAVFAALSDGTRRALYASLGERGEATATELARELPVSRQAVQKHLGTLDAAGLVATRRAGREGLYPPTPPPLSAAPAWIAEGGAPWDDRLAALERQLARRRTL